jgi:hypothetical protein
MLMQEQCASGEAPEYTFLNKAVLLTDLIIESPTLKNIFFC